MKDPRIKQLSHKQYKRVSNWISSPQKLIYVNRVGVEQQHNKNNSICTPKTAANNWRENADCTRSNGHLRHFHKINKRRSFRV